MKVTVHVKVESYASNKNKDVSSFIGLKALSGRRPRLLDINSIRGILNLSLYTACHFPELDYLHGVYGITNTFPISTTGVFFSPALIVVWSEMKKRSSIKHHYVSQANSYKVFCNFNSNKNNGFEIKHIQKWWR